MGISQNRKIIASSLQALRQLDRSRLKVAELGGDGQDIEFEQAFSNLAHAALRDKAPGLQDYELGFQLIERNKDNTKAAGILGFQVGRQLLYAPVFFINGDLKGHEVLYIKNQDQFVPLKENWLNHIINRRPHIIGETIDKSPAISGVTQPDLRNLVNAPNKYASAMASWALPGAAVMAHLAYVAPNDDPKFKNMLTLPAFIKGAGLPYIEALCRLCEQHPEIGIAVQTFHGLDFLKQAIKAAVPDEQGGILSKKFPMKVVATKPDKPTILPPEHKPIKQALTIYTSQNLPIPNRFTESERERLLQDGILVKDAREETSAAYKIQEPLALTTPIETGIYDLFVKPGKFDRCLVILKPYTDHGSVSFAVVVRQSDKKRINIHPSHLLVRSDDKGDGYKSWFDGLPEANGEELRRGSSYIALGPRGNGTVPFEVRRKILTDNDSQSYEAWFDDYADHSRADGLYAPPNDLGTRVPYQTGAGRPAIHFTGKEGGRIQNHDNSLYVPAGFRLLALTEPEDREEDGILGEPYSDSSDTTELPLLPGTHLDLQHAIYEKTARLKVYHSGSEVNINDRVSQPLDGLIHLMRDHGFSEDTARGIMQEAELAGLAKTAISLRVKYAADYPYDLQNTGTSAPDFPGQEWGTDPVLGIPATEPQHDAMNVEPSQPPYEPTEYTPYDPNAIQTAQTAAQTGQREVFDASVIGSILRTGRSDTMIDRHIGDLMKAMDRLCRILLSLYWHGEEFQERFGKADMPDLEDGLRNTIEGLGDVILQLKEKMSDNYPEEMGHPDLQEIANA